MIRFIYEFHCDECGDVSSQMMKWNRGEAMFIPGQPPDWTEVSEYPSGSKVYCPKHQVRIGVTAA